MANTIKYNIKTIEKVHNLMNEEGLTKKDALKRIGIKHLSTYHSILKRLKLKEKIEITPSGSNHSSIFL